MMIVELLTQDEDDGETHLLCLEECSNDHIRRSFDLWDQHGVDFFGSIRLNRHWTN
jgi:hypothetical protein